MKIAQKNVTNVNSDLSIDVWSQKHNKNYQLIETFEGKVPMTKVSEHKYLRFILSEDGSNLKHIIEKQKRANGILSEIEYMFKLLGGGGGKGPFF